MSEDIELEDVVEPEPEPAPIPYGSVPMRIVGRDVEVQVNGRSAVVDRGDVVSVDSAQAKQLFQEGKAIPEDMRPEGAPIGVEKR